MPIPTGLPHLAARGAGVKPRWRPRLYTRARPSGLRTVAKREFSNRLSKTVASGRGSGEEMTTNGKRNVFTD
jgi:hypothetical protein